MIGQDWFGDEETATANKFVELKKLLEDNLKDFQIEEQVKKTGKIGPEIERMAKFGAVTPDAWMVNASGEPVSSGPLLRATEAALKK